MNNIIYNKGNIQKVIDNKLINNINMSIIDSRVSLLSKVIRVSDSMIDFFYGSEFGEYKSEELEDIFSYINNYNKEIKLSFNIMTYNEERCIKRCLDSIVNIADEIIILDTGSTDNTINIIKNYPYPIKLLFYNEEFSFSKCRNILIDNSSYEWIFSIDADEYLDSKSESIKDFIALFDDFAYKPLTISPKIVGHDNRELLVTKRIFNKTHNIKFFGDIHEELRLIDTNSCLTYNIITNFVLNHDGYKKEIIDDKNKIERNIELLVTMIEKEPNNIRWYYFLAREQLFKKDNDKEEIIRLLYSGLDLNKDISKKDVREFTLGSLVLLCEIFYSLGEFQKLEETLVKIKENFKDSSDYYYYLHLITYNKQLLNILNSNNYTIKNLKSIEFPLSFLHSQQYHLYKVLGLSYFTIGRYDLAFKLWSEIENDDYLKEIEGMLLNAKSNIDNFLEVLQNKISKD